MNGKGKKMQIQVSFFSYFTELTGCAQTLQELPAGGTLHDLYQALTARFPKLAAMERSTLMAVGVDYQTRDYVLREGDEVSLFPPVQGG
jgi:molybdopterin converting factor small subunit